MFNTHALSRLRSLTPLAVTLALPLAMLGGVDAAAQMPGMGAPGAPQDPAQEAKMKALMADQMRIRTAHETAFKDPKVAKAREKLRVAVEAEMKKNDKTIAAKIKRFHEIEGQLKAMQASGNLDREKAMPMMTEIQGISSALSAAEKKAHDSKAIKGKLAAFEKILNKKVAEVDPGVPALMDKLEKEMASMGMAPPK